MAQRNRSYNLPTFDLIPWSDLKCYQLEMPPFEDMFCSKN